MEPLVANAIHDIKNSLHVLNSWLGEARTQAPSPALDEARDLSARINAQLVELLAIYRDDEGTLRLAIDDRDLRQFIEEVEVEPILSRGSTVKLRFDTGVADTLFAWAFDAYQVKLILLDALRNGARHASSTVCLTLESATDGGIIFSVTDDGPGYSGEILASTETAMNNQGSGLGLRFARLIARRHTTPKGAHGDVWLDNQGINGGARLRLYLP